MQLGEPKKAKKIISWLKIEIYSLENDITSIYTYIPCQLCCRLTS